MEVRLLESTANPEEVICRATRNDYMTEESVIEEFLHRDHGAARIVSTFVVGDCDDEAKTEREEHLRSCVNAASGAQRPEAAVLD